MIDELPLSDELNRKAIEALIRIADEQSRSLMSEREARLAIRAVFESVQGLVGKRLAKPSMWRCRSSMAAPSALCFLCTSNSQAVRFCTCPFAWRPTKSKSSTHQRANGASRSSAKVARTH